MSSSFFVETINECPMNVCVHFARPWLSSVEVSLGHRHALLSCRLTSVLSGWPFVHCSGVHEMYFEEASVLVDLNELESRGKNSGLIFENPFLSLFCFLKFECTRGCL